MSVQIYKDGKLTPVAGELYESGNVVPLANHANTANTANRAIADANGKDIATTFMPRGIDFKAGPIYEKALNDRQSFNWTATEDCFLIGIFTSGTNHPSDAASVYIEDVEISKISAGGDNIINIILPIKKGQTIRGNNGYSRETGYAGIRFYRYIY